MLDNVVDQNGHIIAESITAPKTMPQELCKALVKFQKECPPITKTKLASIKPSFSYKYSDIADVISVIKAPLANAGLGHMQPLETVGDSVFLVTRLFHESGQYIESRLRIVATGTPQEFGSRLTYLRRYSLCAITGVAPEDEDDDGAKASAPKTLNDSGGSSASSPLRKMTENELRLWKEDIAKATDIADLTERRQLAWNKADEYGDIDSRKAISAAATARYNVLTGKSK